MPPRRLAMICAALLCPAACAELQLAAGGDALPPVPEGVAALAGPGQDLQTARLLPEDGCYGYLHDGPVETTLLPLRTAQGRPICAGPPEPAAPPEA